MMDPVDTTTSPLTPSSSRHSGEGQRPYPYGDGADDDVDAGDRIHPHHRRGMLLFRKNNGNGGGAHDARAGGLSRRNEYVTNYDEVMLDQQEGKNNANNRGWGRFGPRRRSMDDDRDRERQRLTASSSNGSYSHYSDDNAYRVPPMQHDGRGFKDEHHHDDNDNNTPLDFHHHRQEDALAQVAHTIEHVTAAASRDILSRWERWRKERLKRRALREGRTAYCEPPPISGNVLGEYGLACAYGDSDEEAMMDCQREEIARLRDRVAELENELDYANRRLEGQGQHLGGSECSSSSGEEKEETADDGSGDDEEGSSCASDEDGSGPQLDSIVDTDCQPSLIKLDSDEDDECHEKEEKDEEADKGEAVATVEEGEDSTSQPLVNLEFQEAGFDPIPVSPAKEVEGGTDAEREPCALLDLHHGGKEEAIKETERNPDSAAVVVATAAGGASGNGSGESATDGLLSLSHPAENDQSNKDGKSSSYNNTSGLTPDQIRRYSRHLLLDPGFGVEGQRRLLDSSVLVIGAGGIGSTVLLYLASSGIGRIGVVDFDTVDVSNLHRQVIHGTDRVGVNKAVSAAESMRALNPTIEVLPIEEQLHAGNALDLVGGYDVVVDASDNPRTRYLINDACVLSDRPLVSGSAIGTEGQLTVYNWKGGTNRNDDNDLKHERGGDVKMSSSSSSSRSGCYRCLYPKTSPSEGCKSCSDNGVLGTVPGLIGILQATEVIKILAGFGSTAHDRLLMYDSAGCSFLSIKKPPARKTCAVCGPNATIKTMEDSMEASRVARGPTDPPSSSASSAACGADDGSCPVLPAELCVSAADYHRARVGGEDHVLLDVRVRSQYEICSLDGSTHFPLERLLVGGEDGGGDCSGGLDELEALSGAKRPIYCLCRRGVASAEATRIIADAIERGGRKDIHSVRNITGGLVAWANEVDESFPVY